MSAASPTRRSAFLIALGLALSFGSAAAAEEPCPPHPQPLPPAIDAIGKLDRSDFVSFSATPWEYPGRAWVFRLSRQGTFSDLEILRLRRQESCNRYDIERSWKAPISAQEYSAIVEAVTPWSVPGGDASRDEAEVTTDGTGIELRVGTFGWEVRRQLNHYGRSGGQLSAIFRKLATKHVPADELPAENWSTVRKR